MKVLIPLLLLLACAVSRAASVRLGWDAPATNLVIGGVTYNSLPATNYSIYVRYPGGSTWNKTLNTGTNLTGVVPNLTIGPHSFRVTAWNVVGETLPSNEYTVNLPGQLAPQPVVTGYAVVQSAPGVYLLAVSWTPAPIQAVVTNYLVNLSKVGAVSQTFNTLSNSITLTNLTPGLYSVSIAGQNDLGTSQPSLPLNQALTTGGAPGNFRSLSVLP